MIQWVIRVEKKWRPLPLCEVTMITEEFRMELNLRQPKIGLLGTVILT